MSFVKCHISRLAVACENSTLKIGFSAFHGPPTFSQGLRLIWGAYRTSLYLLARAPRFSGKWVSSEYRPGAHLSQYEIILLLCRRAIHHLHGCPFASSHSTRWFWW